MELTHDEIDAILSWASCVESEWGIAEKDLPLLTRLAETIGDDPDEVLQEPIAIRTIKDPDERRRRSEEHRRWYNSDEQVQARIRRGEAKR